MIQHAYKTLRIGLAGLGLREYWSQFAGLEARLREYLAVAGRQLAAPDRVVVDLGMVDTYERALDAAHCCRQQDIDILLLHVTTYALSATVLPLLARARVPVLLLNLQPRAAIDYNSFNRMESRVAMTGEWLAYCSACPVPELANVMRRLDLPFHQVTGMLTGDAACWQEIDEWLTAARVAKILSHSRLGLLGHLYGGMLDVATDLVQVSGRFGLDICQLEVDDLSQLRRSVSDADADAKVEDFHRFFDMGSGCAPQEILRAARTAVALDRLVEQHGLDLLAYYHRGDGISENEDAIGSIILGASMLTGRNVPVAGEYEIKNVVAMKILDLLGVGGSFTEFYATDFAADLVLMGHDGPGHVRIAQDRIKVRPLSVYHGKVGHGLSVEMSVRHGPVTMLSILEDRQSGFSFLSASAESVPGAILEIGNTNSRYKVPGGARRFVQQWSAHGPAHHCAIGSGDCTSVLSRLARLLAMPHTVVA